MPDDRRFSEREIERRLRDLGAGIEYPPTPDVARTVRLRLEEEEQTRRTPYWPPFLAPRWTAVAAALVLISVVALSPAIRATLSDLFVPGQQTGSEAGGSAARPESGGSEDLSRSETDAASQAAGAPAAGEEGATGCPSPSIEAKPARAAPGEHFRMRGYNFSSGCEGTGITPAHGIRIYLKQGGKTWKLATLDTDESLTFDARLRIPASARQGPARVQAISRSDEPAEERFVVLR